MIALKENIALNMSKRQQYENEVKCSSRCTRMISRKKFNLSLLEAYFRVGDYFSAGSVKVLKF